jgi:hypothetical protein
MIEIPSKIVGKHYDLFKLEQLLKPKGFIIGGNWEYDHGSFDYKIADKEQEGYVFLRLPFTAMDGQLDTHSCTVEFGQPYLLSHIYQAGIDDDAHSDNSSATFNQFQEPVDKDGSISQQYVDEGRKLVKEVEETII